MTAEWIGLVLEHFKDSGHVPNKCHTAMFGICCYVTVSESDGVTAIC